MERFEIQQDITLAETLPASFYRSEEVFEQIKEIIFVGAWHWIGDESDVVPLSGSVYPMVLLDGYLTEPLLLTKDEDGVVRCMTNVCTHRGMNVASNSGKAKRLRCEYHGRVFGLDGTFISMPEFEDAKGFPRACDSLHAFGVKKLGSHLFVGLDPVFDLDQVLGIMHERIGFLPLHEFTLDKNLSKDYIVNCHWALYCDNYLEGFHIPFVHDDLNKVLDYGSYETVVYDHCNLQIGYAKGGEEAFDLPDDHMDYGKHVAAYYYWVFPNMMFNFYPWGLSVNVVRPLSLDKTKVSFITYIYDESRLADGAGSVLDKVEREDEFVVEGVHKGIKSRFYQGGRFSPRREKGVHHFHGLLAKYLSSASSD